MPIVSLTDSAPWNPYRNPYLANEYGLPEIGQEPVEVSKEAAEYLLAQFPGCFEAQGVAPKAGSLELEPEPDISADKAKVLEMVEGMSAAEASSKIYEGDFDGYLAIILDEEQGDTRVTVRRAAEKRINKISTPPE